LSQAIASFEDFLAIAPQVARGAAWTPFGAGPATAWAAAEGRSAAVALHLAVAAAWCLAALALWHLAVRRTVEPVAVGGGRSRRVAAGA
ncbi:Tat (twin-arginine translocation) pathway signal sequence, partial [Xanthomonas citri pv. citri]|nr:Tat (twin-arginine translocation) pathway signal sequence [Xanthomonas citri pv. citri]